MDDQNNKNNLEDLIPDIFDVDISKTEDDEFADLEKSLASQISDALGISDETSASSEQMSGKNKNWFQRIPLWIRILVLGLLGLILALVLGINAVLDHIVVEFDGERVEEQFDKDENEGGLEEVDPDTIVWEETDEVKQEDNIINILLVGEEAIDSYGSRGRTDSIMVVSVDFEEGSVKLISLMRDLYLQIPGYKDNKLNSAYSSGGIPLLEETIELNFDINIDGSVLVGFEGFEQIINSLGGVELNLTEDEAYYLNHTNYISNPAYRNVSAGKQILNGNQALGYMRIRYVRTSDNKSDDFGRTSRQRTLLNAIFEKYKTASLAELLGLVNDLLPYVQTDVSKTDIISYATKLVSSGFGDLETMSVPQDRMYDPVYVRGMAVLVPHLPENVAALHEFIYGTEETE